MKRALMIFVVTAGIAAMRVDSFACTCDLPSPTLTHAQQVNEARSDARAVFSGKVVAITKVAYSVRVVFKVEGFWKGNLPSQVVVTTGRGNGDCGYRFEIGGRYLVYANGIDRAHLGTNICQRTAILSDSENDLKALGKSRRPHR